MSQFRKDVFAARRVIAAETEAVRPRDFRSKKFTREGKITIFGGSQFRPLLHVRDAARARAHRGK